MNTRSTADQLTTALAQKQLRNRSIPTFAAEDLAPRPPSSGLSTPASDREDSQKPLVTTITTQGGKLKGTTSDTITHTGVSGVTTAFQDDGSIAIRPIPARGTSSTKVKSHRVHNFIPRTSHFDRTNVKSQTDPFRGFFTLFWIFIFVGCIRTFFRTYDATGSILGLEFGKLISKDALALALSDGVMVFSTFLCVPFVRLLNSGWLRYHGVGIVLQHVLQTAFLAISVSWTFHRNWPWVQSGFMTLHTLSTLMKVHSYCSTNGEFSEKSRSLAIRSKVFANRLEQAGGLETVEREARAEWERSKDGEKEEDVQVEKVKAVPNEFEPHVEERTPPETPTVSHSPSTLTRRRPVHPTSSSSAPSTPSADDSPAALLSKLDVLTWHPNPALSELAIELADLRDAITSTGVNKVRFPDNLRWYNFFDFMLVPTLVYELEYPRTHAIRPMYVIEKTLATLGTFSILYMCTEHYILPISPSTSETSFLVSALDLSLPFMVNYLLVFYIIFDCILFAFAELTCFADREFYQDWWNSTSFDEFARRWNVPVHAFLLKHVYTSTITTYKFSKSQAAFVTFLLSACVHELVMAVVTKKLRFYLFAMQMCQLPLIMIGRLPILKRYPALGNLVFWLGLWAGFPLLAVAYLRF